MTYKERIERMTRVEILSLSLYVFATSHTSDSCIDLFIVTELIVITGDLITVDEINQICINCSAEDNI